MIPCLHAGLVRTDNNLTALNVSTIAGIKLAEDHAAAELQTAVLGVDKTITRFNDSTQDRFATVDAQITMNNESTQSGFGTVNETLQTVQNTAALQATKVLPTVGAFAPHLCSCVDHQHSALDPGRVQPQLRFARHMHGARVSAAKKAEGLCIAISVGILTSLALVSVDAFCSTIASCACRDDFTGPTCSVPPSGGGGGGGQSFLHHACLFAVTSLARRLLFCPSTRGPAAGLGCSMCRSTLIH